MKKILRGMFVTIAIIVLGCVIVGMYVSSTNEIINVCEGVIQLETTTKDTSYFVNKFLSLFCGMYDGVQGKCSTVVKKISNGDTVVSRNLDTLLSNYPIYLGSTNIEGYYQTVYATSLETLGPTYDFCVKNGIPKYMAATVPFIACDSLNSEGLYMEFNMRMNQKDEKGNFVFSCSGTNKDSNARLNACEVPTYVTLRCKSTAQAVELIKTLDIYTTNDDESWTLCFIIADAKGEYGLLELGCNEVRWLPGQDIQTNYYISEDYNSIQKYKQGIGRYEYLETNLNNVKTEDDMLKLMKDVRYSEIYNIDNPNYNIRSEFAGDEDYLTNEYLDSDSNWEAFVQEYKMEVNQYNSMSDKGKKDACEYWNSIYTTIANCNKKTLSLSFFENYEISYILNFK